MPLRISGLQQYAVLWDFWIFEFLNSSQSNVGAPYLHKNRRPQVFVPIPPVARAAGAAAGAEDALVEPILRGERRKVVSTSFE